MIPMIVLLIISVISVIWYTLMAQLMMSSEEDRSVRRGHFMFIISIITYAFIIGVLVASIFDIFG